MQAREFLCWEAPASCDNAQSPKKLSAGKKTAFPEVLNLQKKNENNYRVAEVAWTPVTVTHRLRVLLLFLFWKDWEQMEGCVSPFLSEAQSSVSDKNN